MARRPSTILWGVINPLNSFLCQMDPPTFKNGLSLNPSIFKLFKFITLKYGKSFERN